MIGVEREPVLEVEREPEREAEGSPERPPPFTLGFTLAFTRGVRPGMLGVRPGRVPPSRPQTEPKPTRADFGTPIST
jgi:hypothetical protein